MKKEKVREVTADLERRFLPEIVTGLDALKGKVLAARDRLPQRFPELAKGKHSQPAILHGDLGIVAGAIEEAAARARTALSAASAFRVAVAVLHRAVGWSRPGASSTRTTTHATVGSRPNGRARAGWPRVPCASRCPEMRRFSAKTRTPRLFLPGENGLSRTPRLFCSGENGFVRTPRLFCPGENGLSRTPRLFCSGGNWLSRTPRLFCSGGIWLSRTPRLFLPGENGLSRTPRLFLPGGHGLSRTPRLFLPG